MARGDKAKEERKVKEVPKHVLVEYEKAQDSAEHYNSLLWTLISVGIGLSLIILYKLPTEVPDPMIALVVIFVGMFTFNYFSNIVEAAHRKKCLKYELCKKIEKEWGFYGHNLKSDLVPPGSQKVKGIDTLRTGKFVILGLYSAEAILFLVKAMFMYPLVSQVAITLLGIIFLYWGASLYIEADYGKIDPNYAEILEQPYESKSDSKKGLKWKDIIFFIAVIAALIVTMIVPLFQSDTGEDTSNNSSLVRSVCFVNFTEDLNCTEFLNPGEKAGCVGFAKNQTCKGYYINITS